MVFAKAVIAIAASRRCSYRDTSIQRFCGLMDLLTVDIEVAVVTVEITFVWTGSRTGVFETSGRSRFGFRRPNRACQTKHGERNCQRPHFARPLFSFPTE